VRGQPALKPVERFLRRFAVLVVSSGLLAQASILNTGQVSVAPNFTPFSPFSSNVTQPGLITIAGCGSGAFNSSGCGSLLVDYGVIKMSGDAAGSLNTLTRGIFRDDLTFTGGPTGSVADVTFAIGVNGDLGNPTPGGQASWQLQADLGGGAFDINKEARLNGETGFSGDAFGLYIATVQVQFGFAAPLDVELTGSAQAAFDFNAPNPTASYDLAHPLLGRHPERHLGWRAGKFRGHLGIGHELRAVICARALDGPAACRRVRRGMDSPAAAMTPSQ
jgi:hypothetical protein